MRLLGEKWSKGAAEKQRGAGRCDVTALHRSLLSLSPSPLFLPSLSVTLPLFLSASTSVQLTSAKLL